MKFTDTSEAGLETTIVKSLIEEGGFKVGTPPNPAGLATNYLWRKPEPELDQLSNIIKTFNDLFGRKRRPDWRRYCNWRRYCLS
ncbi:MAG: hypothetical protein HQK61_10035 [Desulfamplus sp.]|nr:hypothetical protein [Desulfamplus sp.]